MDSLNQFPPQVKPPQPRGPFSLDPPESLREEEGVIRPTLPHPKRKFFRFFFYGLGFLIFLLLMGLCFYFLAGVTLTRSIHFENRELSFFQSLELVGKSFFEKTAPLKGERDGQINILLLGRAGEHYPGKNLTDTLMVMSLDTKNKKVALLSLPRDLFAPIPGTETSTKLNSLYQIGLSNGTGASVVEQSVAYITGLPLDYYAVIDFDGFEKVVDTLGGIRVDVVRNFHDPSYPGKNYSYETFDIEAGWQKLDGTTALKYARERHNDPEGDFGRAKRQQQIIEAMREKAFSLPTFLNPFTLYGFLKSLGKSITTDISPEELRRFLEIGRTFDTQNVVTLVVDAWKKESLLRVSHIETPGGTAFILVPRSGNWDEIHALAQNLFDPRQSEERKASLNKEDATLTIMTAPHSLVAAQALQASIKNEFPLEKVNLVTLPTLEKSLETAMIEDRVHLTKPFTLDALMHRYALEKAKSLPLPQSFFENNPTDFVLLFTRSSFEDATLTETEDNTEDLLYDFQTPLPSQPARSASPSDAGGPETKH